MTKRKMNSAYFALRWKVLKRDKYTCQYCGQYAPNVKLEVDHVIAVEDGGTDDPDNLKTSCYACNRGKSGLRIQEERSGLHYSGSGYKGINGMLALRPRQDAVYELLASNPNLTARELAEMADMPAAKMGLALLRLNRRGLVSRSAVRPFKWIIPKSDDAH